MYDAWLDVHVDYADPDEPDDEWTDSAENEPVKECADCGCEFEVDFEGITCPDCANREYARMLMEEGDE